MGIQHADVEEQYKKFKDLKKEDVVQLQEWMKMQPHLPEIDELHIILFLHSCYYSNEATKKTIDNYFTAKAHCPEFFKNLDPNTNRDFNITLKSLCTSALPTLTKKGHLVFISRLMDFNPDVYIPTEQIKLFSMVAQKALLEGGCHEGHEVILDYEGSTFSHLIRMTLPTVKKLLYFIQECIPLRLKAVHFVHPPPFMDKVMSLIKPFLKKELQDMIKIHMQIEDLHKLIDKETLPIEFGGTWKSFAEIHPAATKEIMDNLDHFIAHEKFITDESKRPGKPIDAGEIFGGIEGTFKKLDFD